MKARFQLSIRSALTITGWVAVFCANRALAVDIPEPLVVTLIIVPPSAIVGALVGHHVLGILCGLAAAATGLIWDMFPIYTI